MKLIRCKKCSKLIQGKVRNCLECKTSPKKDKRESTGQIARVLFWGFSVFMAIWHIGYWLATISINKNNINASNVVDVMSTTLIGSWEIVVYWLAGSLFLGIWALLSRQH